MGSDTAIYLRVSSTSQTHKNQQPELETWAKAHGVKAAIFSDTFTGTQMARPGMDELLAAVRAGKVKRVVVWSLDRLGRTAKGLLELCEEFQRLGVVLVSLREGLDLSTPAGRLVFGILASVAAWENEVRRERQIAGILRAREEGKRWGGRKAGTRVKVTAEKERSIAALADKGEPIAAIARTTGLSRPTVYKILGKPQPEAT